MKRFLLAVAILLVQPACSAKAEDTPGDILISTGYATAQMLLRDGDIAALDDALESAVDPEVFRQVSPAKQYEVAQLYARGASASGRWTQAHHGFQLATQSPRAGPFDWSSRLKTAVLMGDGADAMLVLAHEAEQGRPVLETLDQRTLYDLDSLVSQLPNAAQARLALGREMDREELEPSEPYEDLSLLWLHYTQALLEAGDANAAAAAAAHIDSPMVMMAMQADRRFDTLLAANPAGFDPKTAAERILAAAREHAGARPRVIGYRVAEVRALNILNRPTEALDLLDVLAKTPDLRNSYNCWCVYAWRQSVLISLGRGEEALPQRAAATEVSDPALPVLQLAETQLLLGHALDARKTLKDAPTEGLGLRAQMDFARTAACAIAATGQGAEMDAQLAFLAAHQAWKPEAYIEALLCADRMPAAAAALVQELQDPKLRLAALTNLQVYGADLAPSAHERMLTARWAALRALPQVRAEVDKVGRIRTYDLLQWESVT